MVDLIRNWFLKLFKNDFFPNFLHNALKCYWLMTLNFLERLKNVTSKCKLHTTIFSYADNLSYFCFFSLQLRLVTDMTVVHFNIVNGSEVCTLQMKSGEMEHWGDTITLGSNFCVFWGKKEVKDENAMFCDKFLTILGFRPSFDVFISFTFLNTTSVCQTEHKRSIKKWEMFL